MNRQEVCRTCLRSGGAMSSLFDSALSTTGLESITISAMLKIVIEVQISCEDGFPLQICTDCLDEVQRSYRFKIKCQRSEAILHQLKDVKVKLKKLENIPTKFEYVDNKTFEPYKELNLNISQIKNENIECVEIMNEDEKGSTESKLSNTSSAKYEEFTEDGQLEQHNLQNGVLDPMGCAYNITQKIQNIKQEPELHIVMDEGDFCEIDMETNESEYESITEFLRCPGCSWKFLNSEILNKHIIDNHMENQFCKICTEEFECTAIQHCFKHLSTNLETRHVSTTSTNKTDENGKVYRSPFKCKVCFKAFLSDQSRNEHMTMEHEMTIVKKGVQCSICSESFKYESYLLTHMGLHVDGDQLKCYICSKTFRSGTDLKTHLIMNHVDHDTAQNIHKLVKRCGICSKRFPSQSHLITHLRIHTNEMPFKCKICFKDCGYMTSLKRHMRTRHARVDKFKCHICFQAFPYKADLNSHLTVIHADDDQNIDKNVEPCDLCSKIFTRKSDLTTHLQIHRGTGEEPFRCELCMKTFRSSTGLRNHMRISHSDDQKDLKCSLCSRMFGLKSDLTQHMRRHTGDKRFKCKSCSQSFRYQGNLKNHVAENHAHHKSHIHKSDIRCEICSQIFAFKKELTAHLRIHSKEMPFKCKICLKAFECKPSLKLHMRMIHATDVKEDLQCSEYSNTEEKPFKCETCSETFRYKITFKNHMRTKHVFELHPIQLKALNSIK